MDERPDQPVSERTESAEADVAERRRPHEPDLPDGTVRRGPPDPDDGRPPASYVPI